MEGRRDHPVLQRAGFRRKAPSLDRHYMILTIPYPNIDPVFLRIGPVQLRWYGLMYMLSFIIGFFVLRRLAKYRKLSLSTDDLYDLLFYFIFGVSICCSLGSV